MTATFRALPHKYERLPIHWRGREHTHACEGADVHQGVRLIWTLCEIDVPANAAYLPIPPREDPVTCPKCITAAHAAGIRAEGE